MVKRVLVILIALVLALVAVRAPGWAAPLLQARSVITYPTDGMTVSGVVDITGIATHPSLSFYQLRYAAGAQETGESQWIDFAVVQSTPVDNGVLAGWDTTIIPDGQYTLALAVWGENDANSPYVVFVRRVTVNNAQPVPSPTSEEPTETPEPEPTIPAGPSPTPMSVELPATSTPRPSPTPLGTEDAKVSTPSAPVDDDSPSVVLDVGELRSAFCAGGTISMLLLSLWGIYLVVKAGVRWFLRERIGPSQD
ncbi:MAG: hypothetical protein GX620_09995 [Chloroflexi bacterium]|nr:hypothetical protein [Chloroflexota bacterium]